LEAKKQRYKKNVSKENPWERTESAGVDEIERGAQYLIAFWHQVIQDLHLADYSRVGPDGKEVMAPEHPGPTYAARCLAIAHLVLYDAYVGVMGNASTYLTYSPADLPIGIPGV
jgi:hypothetical protein